MANIMLEKNAKEIENIFCIGRNYAKHIEELNNATPTEPLVFLKPTSALSSYDSIIELPAFSDDIHYETEIVLYIGKSARNVAPEDALALIAGYGVGLDLTARDIQSIIKAKGEPWTKCKGFPSAAIVIQKSSKLSYCFLFLIADQALFRCFKLNNFSLQRNDQY